MNYLNTLKRVVLLSICISAWQGANAQDVYTPSGTAGIASSGNSFTGIGAAMATPAFMLDVNGDINIEFDDDDTYYAYQYDGIPILSMKRFNTTSNAFEANANLLIGHGAGNDLPFTTTTGTNSANTLIGYRSGYLINGINSSNQYGTKNTFVGYGTGTSYRYHYLCTFIGNAAGQLSSGGAANTFVGNESGTNNSGIVNTAVGHQSQALGDGNYNVSMGGISNYNNSGDFNVVLGYGARGASGSANIDHSVFLGAWAGERAKGSRNTFVGYQSGRFDTSGVNNAFLGFNTGIANRTGSCNAFFGYLAGDSNITGDSNTFIGGGTGFILGTNQGNNNTVLGKVASVDNSSVAIDYGTAIGAGSVVAASNSVVLGRNNSTDRVFINDDGTAGLATGNVRLYVAGDMEITGTYYPSDQRYKANIKTIESATDKISKLNGVTYSFKKDAFPKKGFREGTQFGFIAQELKEILPEVVVQKEDGYYAVDYTMIIPVLAQAIKEQQQQIEELKAGTTAFGENRTNGALDGVLASIDGIKNWQVKVDAALAKKDAEIAQLKERVSTLENKAADNTEVTALKVENDVMKAQLSAMEARFAEFEKSLAVCCNANNGTGVTIDKARLEQNTPNPFSANTVIKYYIPQSAGNAHIAVTTAEGSQLMKIDITEKGSGSVIISASTLSSGTYFYSLTVDGELIGAKKMIVVK